MGRRILCWAETVFSALSAIAFLLTVVHHDWIESFFGVDPDAGSGALEWLIAAGLLVVAIVLGVLARRQWVRLAAAR